MCEDCTIQKDVRFIKASIGLYNRLIADFESPVTDGLLERRNELVRELQEVQSGIC
jgi:hypothetical protein